LIKTNQNVCAVGAVIWLENKIKFDY
jgi:hypothetical protein